MDIQVCPDFIINASFTYQKERFTRYSNLLLKTILINQIHYIGSPYISNVKIDCDRIFLVVTLPVELLQGTFKIKLLME